MESKHKSQLDIHSQNTMKQMAALKMELQRAVELTKRKVIVLFTTLLVVYTLVYWPWVYWYPLLVLGASWRNGCKPRAPRTSLLRNKLVRGACVAHV